MPILIQKIHVGNHAPNIRFLTPRLYNPRKHNIFIQQQNRSKAEVIQTSLASEICFPLGAIVTKPLKVWLRDLSMFKLSKDYFPSFQRNYGIAEISQKINGNAFYDVQYHSPSKVISISYQNIQDYLQVIVFKLRNGKLPDYDDKTQTLHISALNKIVFSKASKTDIDLNNQYFDNHIKAETTFERKLLKSAKDLRLAMQFVEDVRI